MAIETLGLPDPASIDVFDGGQDYDLAVGWSCAVPGSVLGVEWFAPTNPPTVTTVAKLWRVSDNALLASKTFVPVDGIRQQILFDTAVPITAATGYRCSVYTDRFTLTFDYPGWPITSGNLSTLSPDGWLAVGAGFPDNGPRTALYHVSPIVQTGEDPPAEGSAAFTLDLAVAGTGARPSSGVAAFSLGLALAGAGQRASAGAATFGLTMAVAATGQRNSQGAAALGLGLEMAGAGSRDSSATAAFGLDLSVGAAGARPSSGAAAFALALQLAGTGQSAVPEGQAAFTLNLALAAAGSNGSTGRPVSPFPFTPSAVTGFPCTPRPVKSFTEVTG